MSYLERKKPKANEGGRPDARECDAGMTRSDLEIICTARERQRRCFGKKLQLNADIGRSNANFEVAEQDICGK